MKTRNIIIGALGAGAAAFIYTALRAQDTANQMQIEVALNAPSFDKNGLKLTIRVTLVNPTGGSLTITKPFVELRQSKDDATPFAVSDISGEELKVPALGRVSFDVFFLIPKLTLITKAISLVMQAKNTGTITAHVRAKSYASILGVKIQSVQDSEFSLKLPDFIKSWFGLPLSGSPLGNTNAYAYASVTKEAA